MRELSSSGIITTASADRRPLPHRRISHSLAGRRALVLGHTGRRRHRQQRCKLAMGCGVRRDAAPTSGSSIPCFRARSSIPWAPMSAKWVPELARLPDPFVHRPWDTPTPVLQAAGVELDAVPRVLSRSWRRARPALAAFEAMKGRRNEHSSGSAARCARLRPIRPSRAMKEISAGHGYSRDPPRCMALLALQRG